MTFPLTYLLKLLSIIMAGFLGSVSIGTGGGGYLGEVSIVGGIPASSITGLTPAQVLFGSVAGAIEQNAALSFDAAATELLLQGDLRLPFTAAASRRISPKQANVLGAQGNDLFASGGIGADGTGVDPAGQGGDFRAFAGGAGADNGGGGAIGGNLWLDGGAGTGGQPDGSVGVGVFFGTNILLSGPGRRTLIRGPGELQEGLFLHDTPLVFGASPYALLAEDLIVDWNTAGGNCAMTIPRADSVPGRTIFVSKTSADVNTVTITPTAGTINNGAAFVLLGLVASSVILYAPSTGNNWIRLN